MKPKTDDFAADRARLDAMSQQLRDRVAGMIRILEPTLGSKHPAVLLIKDTELYLKMPKRELQVLNAMVRSRTAKEIAYTLGLSLFTVRGIQMRIKARWGLNDWGQILAIWAERSGVDLGERITAGAVG